MTEPTGSPPSAGGEHPRRRRRRRIWTWVAVSLAVVVLTSGGVAYGLLQHYEGNITRKDVFAGLTNRPSPAPPELDAQNFLLIGSDTRSGANSGFQGAGDDVVERARSDTAIIAHLSADRDEALLVSIPRDSWVELPPCRQPDGTATEGGLDRFNMAFELGGPTCTIKTVEKLTGIRIDHYLEVDFAGFQRMVDALGGVRLCLPEAVQDRRAGLDLPAGQVTVGGDQALAYVRARYEVGDGGDLGRIERQQKFLAAMVRKATSSETLFRPNRLLSFFEVVSESITTDPDLSLGDLRRLAETLRDVDADRVRFATVPLSDTSYITSGGADVVLWDNAGAQRLFAAIRRDSQPSPSPADSATGGAGASRTPRQPSSPAVAPTSPAVAPTSPAAEAPSPGPGSALPSVLTAADSPCQ